MAESQENIDYDALLLSALDDSLSLPRLGPYVAASSGDRKLAIQTYLWNSRLCKAFLFPLNVAEVTTRNAMHKSLSAEFGGPQWICNPPFPLTAESEASRQKALQRLNGNVGPDDLVAALTFDFWSNLFRREYRSLWARPGLLARTFPNLAPHEDVVTVQLLVANINRFRNRIAHHEPIHRLNHRANLDAILTLIGLRSADARDWVRRCSTVMLVVRTPPSALGGLPGLPLVSTNLRAPLMLARNTPLLVALPAIANARPTIAFVADPPNLPIAITPARIMSLLTAQAAPLDGMVDLNALNLDDVIAGTAAVRVDSIDRASSTGDALAAFFPSNTPQNQRPQVLLITHGSQLEGVMLHPVVRYG